MCLFKEVAEMKKNALVLVVGGLLIFGLRISVFGSDIA